MDRSRQVIGVVLILISIILMVGWEKWGRQTFLTSEILVLNRNVPKGEIVKEEDLRILRVEGARKEWLRPEDRGRIQGREASADLHKGVPFYKSFVGKVILLLAETARLPSAGWVVDCVALRYRK